MLYGELVKCLFRGPKVRMFELAKADFATLIVLRQFLQETYTLDVLSSPATATSRTEHDDHHE